MGITKSRIEFIYHNIQPITNSIGLLSDIVGSIFVASEVVDQFNGKKHKPTCAALTQGGLGGPLVSIVPAAEETEEYKKWDALKYRKMKIGLICLIVGFIFQIASNWVPHITTDTISAQSSSTSAPSIAAPEKANQPVQSLTPR